MENDLFIDVQLLERRKFDFDARFSSDVLSLPNSWRLAETATARGSAELLDRAGSRTIRVTGRIEARLQNACARCLEPFGQDLSGDFDLFFYPASTIARAEERAIGAEETDIGFYEGPGLALADAVQEQIALWLPMRSLCREECRGLCSICGADQNQTECSCVEPTIDLRWQALESLRLPNKKDRN